MHTNERISSSGRVAGLGARLLRTWYTQDEGSAGWIALGRTGRGDRYVTNYPPAHRTESLNCISRGGEGHGFGPGLVRVRGRHARRRSWVGRVKQHLSLSVGGSAGRVEKRGSPGWRAPRRLKWRDHSGLIRFDPARLDSSPDVPGEAFVPTHRHVRYGTVHPRPRCAYLWVTADGRRPSEAAAQQTQRTQEPSLALLCPATGTRAR